MNTPVSSPNRRSSPRRFRASGVTPLFRRSPRRINVDQNDCSLEAQLIAISNETEKLKQCHTFAEKEKKIEEVTALLEDMDINGGDGGESDEDGVDAEELEIAWDEHQKDIRDNGWKECEETVQIPVNHGTAGFVNLVNVDRERIDPLKVKIAEVPKAWIPPSKKSDEPLFSCVDNPGEWSEYSFRPKFSTQKKYMRHELPTGATPAQMDENGDRKSLNWHLFYNGWRSHGEKNMEENLHQEEILILRKGEVILM